MSTVRTQVSTRSRPSLEQQRSLYAWQRTERTSEAYSKIAKGAPALIMSSGLMQALAFWQEKGGDNAKLAEHLCQWLAQRFPRELGDSSFKAVMDGLFHTEDPALLRRATDESLALLRWIRQLAAARRPPEETHNG